jgi:dihydroorotase
MNEILLKNAMLIDGSIADIRIQGSSITEIGEGLSSTSEVMTSEVIECSGLRVLPGFVDLHTHLREPGKESSETVLSGSRSAVRGGFTALSPMANTNPVADSAGVVEQVWRLGKDAGLCDIYPIGAVSAGLMGEHLAEIGAMADSAAQVRIFSDDGKCVSDALLMKRALEYVKRFNGVIAQHAQEPRLTVDAQMNEGGIASELGLAGWPAIAEESIIARDILIADSTKSRLHICHVSTKGSVEIIRWAKSRGMSVTAEVTPHHLLLTEETARTYDPIYKVNPPLRTEEDVIALRAALADGTIDIVATDHAPHPDEDKECEWASAAFGMVGLESAVGIVVTTMIESGLMGWDRLAEVMSITPAKIGGYAGHGQAISVGSTANIVLVNPKSQWVVSRDELLSKSRNTPFHGRSLTGEVVHTIYRGKVVLQDQQVIENVGGVSHV